MPPRGSTLGGRRAVLAAVATAGFGIGRVDRTSLAAFSDTGTASGSLTTDIWSVVDGRVVYNRSDSLYSATQSETTAVGVSGAAVLGSADDRFADIEYGIPYLGSNAGLFLVDETGTTRELQTGSTSPRTNQSLLAAASWNDTSIAVYYTTGSEIYRTAPGTSPTLVESPPNGAKAVVGTGDLTGDGTAELAFVDGSATVRYIRPATDSTSRQIESTTKSPGGGYGVGDPVAIDGYGTVLPAVNGSGGLGLLGANGWVEKALTTGSTARKCPVQARDFDDDGDTELLFAGYSDRSLQYLDDIGGTNTVRTVTDSAGDPIPVDTQQGVH